MTLQPAAVRSPPFRREHRQAPEPCSGTLSGQARAQPGEGWPAGQLPPGPHQPRNAAERAPRGCVCAHAPAVARHETPWACRVPPYQRGGRVPVGPPCGRPVQGPAPSLCPTCPRGVIKASPRGRAALRPVSMAARVGLAPRRAQAGPGGGQATSCVLPAKAGVALQAPVPLGPTGPQLMLPPALPPPGSPPGGGRPRTAERKEAASGPSPLQGRH